MQYPKTPTGKALDAIVAEARERIALSEELREVTDDLIAFTGLSEAEVLVRVARKPELVWGGKGWFYDEWAWHNPASDREIEWFYRSSQSYLFSNARHPSWDMLKLITGDGGVVLDYGGGAAMNTIALMRRGFSVMYYDLGILQSAFARFRIDRHFDGVTREGKLFPPHTRKAAILPGLERWHLENETCDAVVAQDVLEHMRDYRPAVRDIDRVLKPGGVLLERSPFVPPGRADHPIPMHMQAPEPLVDFMLRLGYTRDVKASHRTNLWRKAEA